MSTVVYAWVIDGIDAIFVSDEALDDAYAVTQGFVSTKVGLRAPTGLSHRTNIRDLVPEQTPTTITVDDLDNTLAALFGTAAATADDLITTLEPATDPAPPSLWGKHVGTERIGPAGERREYSAIPGFAVGLKHLGQNEAYANGGAATKVSDGPVIWEGRRCAIYRLEQQADGSYPDFTTPPAWHGTLRAQGEHKMKTFTFACLGPESWLGGSLGTGNFTAGLRVLPLQTFVDDGFSGPTMARASLDLVDLADTTSILHTYLEVVDPDGTTNMGTLTGYDATAAALNTFLDQVIASTDQNPQTFIFNGDGNDIRFSKLDGNDGIVIRWLRGASALEGDSFVNNGTVSSITARLRLFLHEDVWKLLGYDVRQQVNTEGGLDAVEHADQYGRFAAVGFPFGYYEGRFYAANAKAMKASDDNDFDGVPRDWFSSGGYDRTWPPLYRGGTFAWTGEPGQEFQLDTANEVLLSGSLARPLLEDPADNTSPFTIGGGVGEVNRGGVLVLQGPYRRRGDKDQNDPAAGYAFGISREREEGRTIQAIRVCWRATPGGLVTTDTDAAPRLVVQEWITPYLMGFDFPPLEGTWGGHRNPPEGADAITAQPLIVVDYATNADKMTTIIQRVLASTGTATGWFTDGSLVTPAYGLGAPTAVLGVGDNDLGGPIPSDAEDSSLGMGIPASMIAAPEVWDAVGSIPGVHLSRVKTVAGVATSGRELIARLLGPTGVAIGYPGGQYGPFDAWRFGTPEEAVATITPEWYAGTATKDPVEFYPTQGLRQWGALDEVRVRGRIAPVGGEYYRTIDLSASDPGARARSQHLVHRVNGDHLVHPLLPIQGGNWQADLEPRWRPAFAFWGAYNTTLPLRVHASFGLAVFPGDTVLITDPTLLNTLGLYGVAIAVGLVLGRTLNAATEVVTLNTLMAAETDFRMWGPSAVVTEYDEGDPFVLLCEDDGFGDRGGGLDVSGFIEPSYSDEGGDADIEIFEFDGLVWTGGIFGVVASVSATPGTASITLTGALTGAAWNSDRHHVVVLREWGAQLAAWVLRFHAPITAKDGTHTGGQPGIKWRGL